MAYGSVTAVAPAGASLSSCSAALIGACTIALTLTHSRQLRMHNTKHFLQEARSEATATPAGSVYEMEHANGRHPAAEGRRSLASADSGGGRPTREPERGMLKSPSSGSLSALARGGETQ